jgi:hypothetical protein
MPRNAGTQDSIEHDENWLLVERIIASVSFRRAGRLKDLLRYLAEMSIRGQTSDLTEQHIGQAVFGKSANYSPVEDSSVRVHIRQLRLKLHEYFDSEGREEAVIVEIPKGSYALTFHSVPVIPPPLVPEIHPMPEPPPERKFAQFRTIAPWVLTAVLALLLLFRWNRDRVLAGGPPPWPLSAVFANGHRSHIVLADATYGIRLLLSGKSASVENYIKRDFQQKANSGMEGENDNYIGQYTANALLTSWADVAISTRFLKLMPNQLESISIQSARHLQLRDLDDGNYIFVGSPASNPWVLLFENRLNFCEVRSDEVNGAPKSFGNKKPLPGERNAYQGLSRTGVDGEDFATIALLPADSGRGNILIIQGLQQEATEAAGLLLADEGGRRKLKKALSIADEPLAPVYFEVLLRISAVAGSPDAISVVASRTMKY